MDQILFANNVASTLTQSVSPSNTAITVAAGTLFPSPVPGQVFYASIQDSFGFVEHVKVTARSGNVLTVVRGQDGTAATAFSAGSSIEMRFIAEMVRQISPATLMGIANGIAQLDANGFLIASQVPAGLVTAADVAAQYVPVNARNVALGFAGLDITGRLSADTLPLTSATLEQVAALYVPITAFNAPNGVPKLGDDGKISLDSLPSDISALLGDAAVFPTSASFVDLAVTNEATLNVARSVTSTIGTLTVTGAADVAGSLRVGGGAIRGRLTLSTTAPTGVPGPGDEWVQYV